MYIIISNHREVGTYHPMKWAESRREAKLKKKGKERDLPFSCRFGQTDRLPSFMGFFMVRSSSPGLHPMHSPCLPDIKTSFFLFEQSSRSQFNTSAADLLSDYLHTPPYIQLLDNPIVHHSLYMAKPSKNIFINPPSFIHHLSPLNPCPHQPEFIQ